MGTVQIQPSVHRERMSYETWVECLRSEARLENMTPRELALSLVNDPCTKVHDYVDRLLNETLD
jgi:hypothetical protein